MPVIIDSSKNFMRHILKNRFQSKEDQEGVIAVMDDQLAARIGAANADGRAGNNRDAYMFFQGCVAGMLIQAKQTKLHYENTAWEQGRDPNTGELLPNHGNRNAS